jgi:hypothetical protein
MTALAEPLDIGDLVTVLPHRNPTTEWRHTDRWHGIIRNRSRHTPDSFAVQQLLLADGSWRPSWTTDVLGLHLVPIELQLDLVQLALVPTQLR